RAHASPRRLAERPLPEPAAISATPANETPAPTAKRRVSRCIPVAAAKSPANTGTVPKMGATVAAEEKWSAYVHEIWLTKRIAADPATSGRSRRASRSDRSVASVSVANTHEAIA